MSVSEFYNQAQHGMASDAANNRHDLAEAVFQGLEFQSFLDIGTGDGSFLDRIKKIRPSAKLVGLEISEAAVSRGLEKGFDIRKFDLNEGSFPLDAATFDGCFMGELIEHVFSPDHLLREARRVVKPGGFLFLTTPNMASWFNRLSLLLGYQPVFTEVSLEKNTGHLVNLEGMPAGHIRLFTYRALREVVERNGWKIQKAFGIGLNPSGHRAKLAVKALNVLFSAPSLSSGIGLLARSV